MFRGRADLTKLNFSFAEQSIICHKSSPLKYNWDRAEKVLTVQSTKSPHNVSPTVVVNKHVVCELTCSAASQKEEKKLFQSSVAFRTSLNRWLFMRKVTWTHKVWFSCYVPIAATLSLQHMLVQVTHSRTTWETTSFAWIFETQFISHIIYELTLWVLLLLIKAASYWNWMHYIRLASKADRYLSNCHTVIYFKRVPRKATVCPLFSNYSQMCTYTSYRDIIMWETLENIQAN